MTEGDIQTKVVIARLTFNFCTMLSRSGTQYSKSASVFAAKANNKLAIVVNKRPMYVISLSSTISKTAAIRLITALYFRKTPKSAKKMFQ